jgi:hypothetical protein
MGADEARIWEWGLLHIYENLAEHNKILEVLNNFLLQDSEGMAKGFLLYVTGEEFFSIRLQLYSLTYPCILLLESRVWVVYGKLKHKLGVE